MWVVAGVASEDPLYAELVVELSVRAERHRVQVLKPLSLGPDGLTQSVTARNESDAPAPWGTGPHPYLVAGDGRVDGWTLELPAAEVLEVTADRLIPTALVAAAYEQGSALSAATYDEIDDVIDPATTRERVSALLGAWQPPPRGERRRVVDTW